MSSQKLKASELVMPIWDYLEITHDEVYEQVKFCAELDKEMQDNSDDEESYFQKVYELKESIFDSFHECFTEDGFIKEGIKSVTVNDRLRKAVANYCFWANIYHIPDDYEIRKIREE